MTHLYHSQLHLFLAEMRVLAWLDYALVALVLAIGAYTGVRFVRRRRSLVVAAAHLAAAVLAWLAFLGTWYFWQIDWKLWQGRVGEASFILFLAGGVFLLGATVWGLVLHHRRPDVRETPRQLAIHIGAAILAAAAWVMGMRPFL